VSSLGDERPDTLVLSGVRPTVRLSDAPQQGHRHLAPTFRHSVVEDALSVAVPKKLVRRRYQATDCIIKHAKDIIMVVCD
jgi:hypothetical protein